LAFAFFKGLGSRSRKSCFLDGSLGYRPCIRNNWRKARRQGATSLGIVFGEVSLTTIEETPATHPASNAVGRRLNVRGDASLDGAFRKVSTPAV